MISQVANFHTVCLENVGRHPDFTRYDFQPCLLGFQVFKVNFRQCSDVRAELKFQKSTYRCILLIKCEQHLSHLQTILQSIR